MTNTFLCNATAGTAVVLAGATFIDALPASAQSKLTHDATLKALMDGNQRYVGGQLQSLDEDLSILKANTAEKQEPFAAVLSCADSRVPVEFVFDQSIGQLFVVRIAGNVTTPEIIASLEYGVAVLGTHHHEPGSDHPALSRGQPLHRQPRADVRRLPRLSCAGDPQHRHRHRAGHDALGHAASAARRRTASHQHQEHLVTPLARLAEV
jgi:Carbonic anhydrase